MSSEKELCRERDEAIRQFQESHAELQAIYDAVGDGLIIVDAETGHCVRANARMAEMLGYTLETLPLDVRTVHRPEDLPEIAEKFRAQVEGRLPFAENIPFLHKDGSLVYTDISGTPMSYKGRSCVICFVRNVTQRRNAEAALRESEERFRAVFDEAPVGLVIGGPDQTIALANKALCEMTGYAAEDLIGKKVQDFIHPDDLDVSADQVKRLLAGEIDSFTVERRYLAKGGQPFWAQATTATIRGGNGKLAFGLGIVHNIEERKRAREALERERKTLWHMLRSSDHERQLIAYDIHDGLAQQLAAAIMQFQSYEHLNGSTDGVAKTAFEAGLQMLRHAHSESRRLISGVRPPILDESGIVAALAHLVHDQPQIDAPRVEFESQVRFGRLESVLENAIYRIAQEALANACKHSQSDRVLLAIKQEDHTIRLVVQDWGIGFDPESVDGDRFGLDGIRERTRLLGGEITIESQPGEGTTVEVLLPLMARR